GARDGAQRDDVLVRSIVAHHADAANRQQHGERLPDAVVQARLTNLLEVDRVRLSQHVQRLARYGTEHTNADSRSRKWVAANHLLRQSKLAAYVPHLVLEQLTQRLDELELHSWFEAAHVMMRLDRDRRSTHWRRRFDHVRIKCPLHQEFGARIGVASRVLEDVDERVADDAALLLGILHSFERVEEARRCVHRDQVDAEMRTKGALDLLALVKSEKPGVDEYTGELLSDRAMHEGGGD